MLSQSQTDDPTLRFYLSELSKKEGAGVFLRYDPLYDVIREARREEDPNLSQGVWQRELKKPQWEQVIDVCHTILTQTSKDLQIAAWLGEAWIATQGFKGLKRALDLILGLSKSMWDIIHPLDEDPLFESRMFIYDWCDTEYSRRLMLIPITNRSPHDHTSQPLNLFDWHSSIQLDKTIKRSAEPRAILNNATTQGKIELSRFRQVLQSATPDNLENICHLSTQSLTIIEELKEFLSTKNIPYVSNFPLLRRHLEELNRISKIGLEHKKPHVNKTEDFSSQSYENENSYFEAPLEQESKDHPEENKTIISERHHAYQALRDLSKFLSSLDPHSPVPQFLQVIAEWENMSLGQILADVRQRPVEMQMLFKLLASAAEDNNNRLAS